MRTHLKPPAGPPGEVLAGVKVPTTIEDPTGSGDPANEAKAPSTPTEAEAPTVPADSEVPTAPAKDENPHTITEESTEVKLHASKVPTAVKTATRTSILLHAKLPVEIPPGEAPVTPEFNRPTTLTKGGVPPGEALATPAKAEPPTTPAEVEVPNISAEDENPPNITEVPVTAKESAEVQLHAA